MKKTCLLIMLLALCLLPILAFATDNPVSVDPYEIKEDDPFVRYHYTSELLNKTTFDERVDLETWSNYENHTREKSWPYSENSSWTHSEVAGFSVEGIQASLSDNYGEIETYSPGFVSEVGPHQSVDLYILYHCTQKTYYLTKAKEVFNTDTNEWEPTGWVIHENLTETYRKPEFKEDIYYNTTHEASAEPGRNEEGLWGHLCKGWDICGEIVPNDYPDHECDNIEAICCSPGYCSVCGRWGSCAAYHIFDPYTEPEIISENSVRYYCIWKKEGCNESIVHRHIYVSDGTPITRLYLYEKIEDDYECHYHYCLASEYCSNRSDVDYCPFNRRKVVKILDLHSWETETKDPTCYQNGYEKNVCKPCGMEQTITVIPATGDHVYDYDNPIPVAYNVVKYQCITPGCPYYDEHVHKYSGDGPKPTNETREIPENYLQHERKYVEYLECNGGEHCNKKTMTIETWREEEHPWRHEIKQEPTCLEDGFITHICAGCEMVETIPISARGYHDYDYEHPTIINDHVVQYFCRAEGCNDSTTHFHNYMDTDDEPVFTDTTRSVKGDDIQHKRKYLVHQECTGEHCNFTQDDIRWIEEPHDWGSEVVERPATCSAAGVKSRKCAACEYVETTTLPATGKHVYDYDNPQIISEDEVRYYCVNEGCDDFEMHRHVFTDNGDPTPTDDYLEISGDSTNHKRKYMQPRKCTGEHCGITRDFETYKVESHTFVNDGSETKTSIFQRVNADKHQRKYTQAQKCACKQTRTLENWKDESHSFSNFDTASSTSTYRQISGNANQHQRKFNQPQKCSCGETRIVDDWRNDNHNFVNNGSETKTSILRQSNSNQHQRKYTQAKKCSACGFTKTDEIWKDEGHSYSNYDTASSTTTYRQISGNANQHQRKFNQPQKCSCGVTRIVDDWRNDNHNFVNNGSETKTSILRQSNSNQHQRKYTQAKKCSACGFTKTDEIWKNEGHSFSNFNSASSTTQYQQISGNLDQHKRKFNQPQKCSCGVTRIIDEWRNDYHTWTLTDRQAEKCFVDGYEKYKCNNCQMTKTVTLKAPGSHDYGMWFLIERPTATTPGKLKRECRRCGQVHYKNAR